MYASALDHGWVSTELMDLSYLGDGFQITITKGRSICVNPCCPLAIRMYYGWPCIYNILVNNGQNYILTSIHIVIISNIACLCSQC